jgi:hypothetical protein
MCSALTALWSAIILMHVAAGYPAMVKKRGDEFTYDKCPRAKIFAREGPKVKSMEDAMVRTHGWSTFLVRVSLGPVMRALG